MEVGSKGAVCVVASAVVAIAVAVAVAMIVAIAVTVIVAVVVLVAVVVTVVVAVAVVVVTFAVIVARALCDPVSSSLLFKIDEILILFLINQGLIKGNHKVAYFHFQIVYV